MRLFGAAIMPPPSSNMNRLLRSPDPGPSTPAAPGRCPLHQGQLGWSMLLPCEVCLKAAPYSAAVNSLPFKNSLGLREAQAERSSPGAVCRILSSDPEAQAERSSPGAMRKGMTGQDTPWKASTSSLGSSSLGSDGVPPPPPPPPMTCVRHRGGRGWSLLDPCEECLQIAMEADLGVA